MKIWLLLVTQLLVVIGITECWKLLPGRVREKECAGLDKNGSPPCECRKLIDDDEDIPKRGIQVLELYSWRCEGD
ncbi:hypothetical protein GE061_012130 [Apolygus lucorum]|uniref:Uncharacterized protein n=1 Tax=Apolygus lucorum TaxID=248454 RepID=A0A6A4JI58_APOLU|nr:hypothetical protein GE061_012130 [Apolygus lucorum]